MDVDFSTKTATITMEQGRSLSRENCEAAFADTRYKVASFEQR